MLKIQVLVNRGNRETWEDMRPSEGAIYTFNDEEAAGKAALMCYPNHPERVRVVPLEAPAEGEHELPPGSCHCGSTKYKRGHKPWDHSGWEP